MAFSKAALLGAFAMQAAPAWAQTGAAAGHAPAPKAIAAFALADQPVELLAVTRRARADTDFHRRYIEDCEAMAKVYPGYPQPPLMSFDLRFRF